MDSGTDGAAPEEYKALFPGSDDEVRSIFVRLITFVAKATASHDGKNDALQCIEVLQARFLR